MPEYAYHATRAQNLPRIAVESLESPKESKQELRRIMLRVLYVAKEE